MSLLKNNAEFYRKAADEASLNIFQTKLVEALSCIEEDIRKVTFEKGQTSVLINLGNYLPYEGKYDFAAKVKAHLIASDFVVKPYGSEDVFKFFVYWKGQTNE